MWYVPCLVYFAVAFPSAVDDWLSTWLPGHQSLWTMLYKYVHKSDEMERAMESDIGNRESWQIHLSTVKLSREIASSLVTDGEDPNQRKKKCTYLCVYEKERWEGTKFTRKVEKLFMLYIWLPYSCRWSFFWKEIQNKSKIILSNSLSLEF